MKNKELIQKVNREYELYYLEMMTTSRSNVYSKSGEIEFKKRIYGYLRTWLTSHDDVDARTLMTVNNLLDECCRYSKDHADVDEDKCVSEYLSKVQEG